VEAAQGTCGVTGGGAGGRPAGRPGTGRFAPSPTGSLHVGNLRTAALAWLFARSARAPFLLRIDDLDRAGSRDEHVRSHLADLAALGIEGDGPVVRSSQRFDRYEAALARLRAEGLLGLLYPCYCTRREVQAAVAAPHGPLPEGAYPGTCHRLTRAERSARRAEGRRRCGWPAGRGWRRRPTPTCPWCWGPTASGWPSATVRSRWPTCGPGALSLPRSWRRWPRR
jgi:hypothetical protein